MEAIQNIVSSILIFVFVAVIGDAPVYVKGTGRALEDALTRGDFVAAVALSEKFIEEETRKIDNSGSLIGKEDRGNLVPAYRLAALARAGAADINGAVQKLDQLLQASEDLIERIRINGTEMLMTQLLSYLQQDEDFVFSLAARQPQDEQVKRLALRTAFLRKGRSFDEQSYAYLTPFGNLHNSDDVRELENTRALYADFALVLGEDAPDVKENSGAFSRAINDIESRLVQQAGPARVFMGVNARQITRNMGVEDGLLLGLSKPDTLINYQEYRRYDFGRRGSPGSWQEARYLGLLAASSPKQTYVFDLGAASNMENLTAAFLRAVSSPYVDPKLAAKNLYDALLRPMRVHFRPAAPGLGGPRLIVSPEGALNNVQFLALHDGDRFIVEQYQVKIVTSLAESDSFGGVREPSDDVLVFADPDISDLVPSAVQAKFGIAEPTYSAGPLPRTRSEARAISKLFKHVTIQEGASARKDVFLNAAPSAGILHVAAHGEFARDLDGRDQPVEIKSEFDPATPGDNTPSLARSALALAPPLDRQSSGWLSAAEVLKLNLKHTQLVVLSACNTAKGDYRRGQGSFGLQRSFLVAGAETVVMSLWELDDEVGEKLVTAFYENLRQKSRGGALREAALSIMRDHPHPYFWAPFTMVGKDGPLRRSEERLPKKGAGKGG